MLPLIIIYIVAILLMRVVQAVFNKRVNLALPQGKYAYVTYTLLTKVFAAAFALILMMISWDFSGINWEMVLIASCSGLCLTVGTFTGMMALSGGTVALGSLFGTAGMLIPCVLGIFFFGESISVLQIICICVLFGGMVLLIQSSKKTYNGFSLKTFLCLLGSFLSNGLVMFCQKLFGELQPNGNVSMFSFLTFAIPSVIMGVAWLVMFIRRRNQIKTILQQSENSAELAENKELRASALEGKVEPDMPKLAILFTSFLAFAVFIINQFVTLLTPHVSSAVLFSLVNGSATVISTIVAAILYKEKITVKSAVGIVLGVAALICIKVFEGVWICIGF